jgi:glycine reductase
MAGMGHCQLEQQMMHIRSEGLGMKAVTVMPGVSVEKPGDSLVISDSAVDAVIHSGSGRIMEFPYIETLIGHPDIPALMAYDLHGPFTATTNLTVAGIYSKQGAYYLSDEVCVWREN